MPSSAFAVGFDATAGISTSDWLVTPQQRLLGVVEGRVLADPYGELAAVRGALSWYPDPLWRWLIACQWHRIAQEEAFVARTAEVGDSVGSAVTAARLVRDVMRLALWLDRDLEQSVQLRQSSRHPLSPETLPAGSRLQPALLQWAARGHSPPESESG